MLIGFYRKLTIKLTIWFVDVFKLFSSPTKGIYKVSVFNKWVGQQSRGSILARKTKARKKTITSWRQEYSAKVFIRSKKDSSIPPPHIKLVLWNNFYAFPEDDYLLNISLKNFLIHQKSNWKKEFSLGLIFVKWCSISTLKQELIQLKRRLRYHLKKLWLSFFGIWPLLWNFWRLYYRQIFLLSFRVHILYSHRKEHEKRIHQDIKEMETS